MALRRLAADASLRWGMTSYAQAGPALAAASVSVSRAFATVMEDRKYAKSHEWVKVDGDVATVGISEFAQAELGDVVYVELPSVGNKLERNEAFGVVESVKAASDVYAPISGEVTETNGELEDNPSLVNEGPFEKGWLMKVKMSNQDELKELMDPNTYKKEIQDAED